MASDQLPPCKQPDVDMHQPLPVQPQYQPVAAHVNATVVQPSAPGVIYAEHQPQNYLVMSVLTTFFCCFLFGLMAIIYSNKANSAWNSGDHEGAKAAAETALRFNIAAIVAGIVVYILVISGGVVSGIVHRNSCYGYNVC